MDIVGLVVALMSGAGAAYLAAKRGRGRTGGRVGIVVSGAMGGLIGSQVLERAMGGSTLSEGDLGLIVVQSAGGAAGGAALLLIVDKLRALLQR